VVVVIGWHPVGEVGEIICPDAKIIHALLSDLASRVIDPLVLGVKNYL
jgi:hypothetical protein